MSIFFFYMLMKVSSRCYIVGYWNKSNCLQFYLHAFIEYNEGYAYAERTSTLMQSILNEQYKSQYQYHSSNSNVIKVR